MTKLVPIHQILANVEFLPLPVQAYYLRGQLSSEQGGNVRKTSVRIRELQAALRAVQNRRLKVEA